MTTPIFTFIAPITINPPIEITYICDCCGCEFNEYSLGLDIYVVNENGDVQFTIAENTLADGTKWRTILDNLSDRYLSTYKDFTTAIANKLDEQPDNPIIHHLAINYPIYTPYEQFRTIYEYIQC